MPPLFFHAWTAGLVLLAVVYPFVTVCRGRRVRRATPTAWGFLFLYVFLVCGVLPSVVWHYDKALAYQMGDAHFEPPFIFAVFILGWFLPLIASTFGYACRQLWLHYVERHPPGA